MLLTHLEARNFLVEFRDRCFRNGGVVQDQVLQLGHRLKLQNPMVCHFRLAEVEELKSLKTLYRLDRGIINGGDIVQVQLLQWELG